MANRKPHSQSSPEVHTTVRISKEMHERLRQIAQREDRTVSAEIRRLIRERVEQAA